MSVSKPAVTRMDATLREFRYCSQNALENNLHFNCANPSGRLLVQIDKGHSVLRLGLRGFAEPGSVIDYERWGERTGIQGPDLQSPSATGSI